MPVSTEAPDPPERPRPASLADLFLSFTLLALQGFGGVVAIVQRELVERKQWLTREEFVEDWAVAQIMPGPNVVNISLMIGARFFGLPGAIASLAGMLCVPLVVVLLLAVFHARFADTPQVAAALKGMGAVAGGLVGATGLKLIPALKNNPLGRTACAVLAVTVFLLIAILRWPLLAVLPALGAIAWLLAYRRLGK